MTQVVYRTTKIPEYYFKQIEDHINTTNKYVSVSEFLREAIKAMLDLEAFKTDYRFLLLKDLIFTKSRLMQIHELISRRAHVESKHILKQTFGQLVENSIDLDLYTFLAKFLYNFGKYHPFADGNKRTAFIAADAFLRLNNKKLSISVKKNLETKDEIFLWQTSIQQKDVKTIREFLMTHTTNHLFLGNLESEIKESVKENSLLLRKLSR